MPHRFFIYLAPTAALATTLGCASTLERSTQADLRRVAKSLAEPPSLTASPADVDTAEPTSFGGSLAGYLAYAFRHNPSLRASFEDWHAATYRPRQERRLPEPTITYTGFIRAVETRVGPQRHRIGAVQWFPWPTKLTKGGQAASLEAQAAQRRFEARAMEVAAQVAGAYWAVWRVERRRDVVRDEVEILGSLSSQVRARVEVGGAELSDLAQLDLTLSRARDRLAGLDESERVANAALVQAVGAPDGAATPVSSTAPAVAELGEPLEKLVADAGVHPRVTTLATLSDAKRERVAEARADRLPSFGLGVSWFVTGRSQAPMPPPDSGKDAVAFSLSVKVPLWARAYKASEDEARAQGAALRARAIDARNRGAAGVRQQAARLSDDVRRVRVHHTTLVPQAEAALEAVAGSYAAGRSTVAELLLAEKALIVLRDELYAAQADYGAHIADLENAVGRAVRTQGGPDAQR